MTDPEDHLPLQVTLLATSVLFLIATVDITFDVQTTVAFALPAVICSIGAPVRVTALFGVAAVAAALASGAIHDSTQGGFAYRLASAAAISLTAVVSAVVRDRREARLRRMTVIAEAAQRAVLRAMPTDVGNVAFAARYVSATQDALIGVEI